MNSRPYKSIPLPVVLCALFVLIATNLVSFFVFDHIPHIHDEAAYLFQAKIFLLGRLFVPSPCGREHFDFPHMINNGRWLSQYPPGFPFLIAVGAAAGAPWIVNPLLASLSIILFYFLGLEFFNSRKAGLWTAFLTSISPWFLLMSSTMMSHSASLFFCGLFLLTLIKLHKSEKTKWAAASGTALGMAFLIRPVSSSLFALLPLGFLFFHLKSNPRKMRAVFVTFAVSFSFFFGLFLLYNTLTVGHPLKMGYLGVYGHEVLPGFGKTPFADLQHTVYTGSRNIWKYLKSINTHLLGWPLTSLWGLVFLLFTLGRAAQNEKRRVILLFSIVVVYCVFLFTYWGTFLFLGARLMYETLLVFTLLNARGIMLGFDGIKKVFKTVSGKTIHAAGLGFIMLFILHGLVIHFPKWVFPENTLSPIETHHKSFAGTTAGIHDAIKALNIEPALVILKLASIPLENFPKGKWGSGFIFNDPLLKNDIIYAQDLEDAPPALSECYPGRHLYLYHGTTDRGMLFPLAFKNGELTLGEALEPPSRPGRKAFRLVRNPLELHTVYSDDFRDFLKKIYGLRHPSDLGVDGFQKIAVDYRADKMFREEAFALEAALQLERAAPMRFRLLNMLAKCYFAIGKTSEAKHIVEILFESTDKNHRLYFVNPEKGF